MSDPLESTFISEMKLQRDDPNGCAKFDFKMVSKESIKNSLPLERTDWRIWRYPGIIIEGDILVIYSTIFERCWCNSASECSVSKEKPCGSGRWYCGKVPPDVSTISSSSMGTLSPSSTSKSDRSSELVAKGSSELLSRTEEDEDDCVCVVLFLVPCEFLPFIGLSRFLVSKFTGDGAGREESEFEDVEISGESRGWLSIIW